MSKEEKKNLRKNKKVEEELADLIIENNGLKEGKIYSHSVLSGDDSMLLQDEDIELFIKIRPKVERHKRHQKSLKELFEYERKPEKVKFD